MLFNSLRYIFIFVIFFILITAIVHDNGYNSVNIRKFFVIITILAIGLVFVIKIGTVDMHTILAMSYVMIPAVLVMGYLGQKIGEIMDNPQNRADADYKLAVLNALKKMDKSITLQELNDKLTQTVAEPDAPSTDVHDEDVDV